MDKASFAAKRRQDKFHKKPPPPKPAKQKSGPKPPDVQHTAPLVVCDDRYGKHQIQQNWTEDRDLPTSDSEDTEDEQLQAADFEKLLELPPSSASHFLLSSEKRWLQPDTDLPGEDEKNRYSEYFRIDTKLLNASLGCIPFYERHGYEQTLFSTLELNLMRQKAELNTNKFQQSFADQLATSSVKTGPPSQNNKENMPLPRKPQPTPCFVGKFAKPPMDGSIGDRDAKQPSAGKESVGSIEEKLGELKIKPDPKQNVSKLVPIVDPTVPTPITKPATTANEVKDTKEDIQQWLDDILDI
uniref:Uncharacterized protein n=1 Tax=Anopheles epiroticus TaxID=199890 RepID=A0A182PNC9_9DIPT